MSFGEPTHHLHCEYTEIVCIGPQPEFLRLECLRVCERWHQ